MYSSDLFVATRVQNFKKKKRQSMCVFFTKFTPLGCLVVINDVLHVLVNNNPTKSSVYLREDHHTYLVGGVVFIQGFTVAEGFDKYRSYIFFLIRINQRGGSVPAQILPKRQCSDKVEVKGDIRKRKIPK